ncbi:hypothetical protein T296_07390 [Pantoea agglomerans Eh318]|nr:hypothetical protein T296_07390 [Pantoea agglomerans Eh318]
MTTAPQNDLTQISLSFFNDLLLKNRIRATDK